MEIILAALGYKSVLTTKCCQEPVPDASQDQTDLHTKWLKDDKLAKCYMMTSMSSILQHQHESLMTTSEIISNLKEMFGDQGRPARQATTKILMSTKMAEGTPVQEDILKMMDSLNKLEVLGTEIDANRISG